MELHRKNITLSYGCRKLHSILAPSAHHVGIGNFWIITMDKVKGLLRVSSCKKRQAKIAINRIPANVRHWQITFWKAHNLCINPAKAFKFSLLEAFFTNQLHSQAKP